MSVADNIKNYMEGVHKGWAQALPLLNGGDVEKLHKLYDGANTSTVAFLGTLEHTVKDARTRIMKGDFRFVDAMDAAYLDDGVENYMIEAGKATAFWAAIHPDWASKWSNASRMFPGIDKFAKTASRVKDLGVGADRSNRPEAVKRIKQYVKWCREIIKEAEKGLNGLEKYAEKTLDPKGALKEWPPVEDAYHIAQLFGELEDSMGYWIRKG